MDEIREHVINFTVDSIGDKWYIFPNVDGEYRKPFRKAFETEDDANRYLDNNHERLIKRYTPKSRKKVEYDGIVEQEPVVGEYGDIDDENDEINTSDEKIGKIILSSSLGGLLIGASVTGLILLKGHSCEGCIGKGTGNATDAKNGNGVIIFPTHTPASDIDNKVTLAPSYYPSTQAPVQTPTPTSVSTQAPSTDEPTQNPTMDSVRDSLTVEVIEKMASNIYNEYNEFHSSCQLIKGNRLVTLKLSEKDIMNAIICLNCDYLENNHYNTFMELRRDRDADSVIDSYQDVITFISQINCQKYMANKTTKGFMSLSCLLLDGESREMAENFESRFIEIMDANFKSKKKVRTLTDELIDSSSSNNVGLTGIMSIDYSVLATMCKDTMRKDQRRVLYDLCDEYENTNYNAIRGILMSDSIINNPECCNTKVLVRSRYC